MEFRGDDPFEAAGYSEESISEDVAHSSSKPKNLIKAKPNKLKDKTTSTNVHVESSGSDKQSKSYYEYMGRIVMSMDDLALGDSSRKKTASFNEWQNIYETSKKATLTDRIKKLFGTASKTDLDSHSRTRFEITSPLQPQDLSSLEEERQESSEDHLLKLSNRAEKLDPSASKGLYVSGEFLSYSSSVHDPYAKGK